MKGELLELKNVNGISYALVKTEGNNELLWRVRGYCLILLEFKYNRFPDMKSFQIYALRNLWEDRYYRL